MKKITFVGAGSFIFTRRLITDILAIPALSDSTIALFDIDEERLSYVKKGVDRIVEAGKYPAKVIATLDRKEALEGADGVVISILVGGIDVWRKDIEIPMKHGLNISVGDSMGPSGTFRALRTIPAMLEIARDVEKYCPNAVVLNYTNPMSMLSKAVLSQTKINYTGLCHSVQGTAEMLAKWIGAPMNEVTYLCAGINHQAWYLNFKWNGKDAYPLIKEAMLSREGVYYREQVRNEMFLKFGYYVTESSSHNSEYNPWFRKRPELIEKYCHNYETDEGWENRNESKIYADKGWNYGRYANTLIYYESRESHWREDIKKSLEAPVDLKSSHEYASNIFNAVFGDGTLFEFNGNILNNGILSNMPENSCIEVPILASKRGLSPIHVGKLPDNVAILNNINASCHDLAVDGCITGDADKIYHAIYMDPLSSAAMSLDEIKAMVDDMFEANKDWLPQFKHLK